ncbi:Lipid A 3-O-deacylase-like protein [Caballeronia novacaledonica]|uniref:Lipid A deacylase n=1 Tax=Caballeronia novacaledonica TaxID=1544861 RepID=A0A2U3IB05_9BURK|nr:acyloxyacyl hydrolase [Caballeronia novacaledonica]SPB17395.1 Lipid A 3-O-deacylase-like protein [Caballeronia novacaledonica]
MHKNKSSWHRPLSHAAVFVAFGLASAAAHADRFGLQIAGGVADRDIKKADLGVSWDPGLTWWEIGGFHFTLIGEGHVAYWHTTEDNAVHSNIWEFGITPVVRFVKSGGYFRPFIEAGVGVRLLSHTRITEDFSVATAFQFADMVGVGMIFGDKQNYQVGYRFQHLSNGGIKEPNPGINFSQLYLQYNF